MTSETSNGTNTGNQNETVLVRGQSWWVEERARDQLGDHKALSLGLEFFIFNTEEHIWLLLLWPWGYSVPIISIRSFCKIRYDWLYNRKMLDFQLCRGIDVLYCFKKFWKIIKVKSVITLEFKLNVDSMFRRNVVWHKPWYKTKGGNY